MAGWGVTLAPFVLMPRPTFLYSYLPAQVFALLALARLLERLDPRPRRFAAIGLLVAGAAAYLALAPTTYGLPFPPAFEPVFRLLSR